MVFVHQTTSAQLFSNAAYDVDQSDCMKVGFGTSNPTRVAVKKLRLGMVVAYTTHSNEWSPSLCV
jgi:hypothetical protein